MSKKKNNNKKGKKYESCEWHITYNVHLSTHYMQLWYTSILTAVTCIFVYIQEGHEVCMIHNPLYIYFFLILLYGKISSIVSYALIVSEKRNIHISE